MCTNKGNNRTNHSSQTIHLKSWRKDTVSDRGKLNSHIILRQRVPSSHLRFLYRIHCFFILRRRLSHCFLCYHNRVFTHRIHNRYLVSNGVIYVYCGRPNHAFRWALRRQRFIFCGLAIHVWWEFISIFYSFFTFSPFHIFQSQAKLFHARGWSAIDLIANFCGKFIFKHTIDQQITSEMTKADQNVDSPSSSREITARLMMWRRSRYSEQWSPS